ncbi:TonB-dependent receptor [Pendulispora albinea]|uniref:TonB-dependent receptor n=2 Tax=Pendulispora albinea TaxID=2741071 RepID=A0ABZ2MCY0_9BACT
MPGVARPTPGPAFGLPIIRGAGANDSEVYLEGMPVPLLYHFGGITSFINSRMLDRVDLYPGNFSARYGRKLGGIIDVRLKEPKTENGVHGVGDINTLDASVMAEVPIGSKAVVAAAARRSYVDFWFTSVVPKDTFSVVAAPVYYDYQAMGYIALGEKTRLRLMAYGSSDRLDLIFNNPLDADPNVRGKFGSGMDFHRAQIGLRTEFSKTVDQNIELSAGTTKYGQQAGNIADLDIRTLDLYARAEWRFRISPAFRLMAGIDHLTNFADGTFRGQPISANPTNNTEDNPANLGRVSTSLSMTAVHQPAVYLEAQIRPMERLLLIPSVRADYSSQIESATVDPRFAMRFDATDTTAFKGGVGVFSQPPGVVYALSGIGNPNLGYQSSVHSSFGIEQKLGDAATISVEAFHKSLYKLIVDTPGGRKPLIENEGRGRVYGAEFMLRVLPKGRFFGLVSYTLSRSERNEYGGAYHLFDLDQTHNLAMAGVYRLGRGWELGATFRLVSGNPMTPVASATYNANSDVYRARYGDLNSDRSPLFHRLDVRIEKKWTFTAWKLAAYLDIQNLYNQQNREGFQYNYDYSAKKDLPGIPILPSLGLRGEL